MSDARKTPPFPSTSSHLHRGSSYGVTREKKKGGKRMLLERERLFFSGLLIGHQTPGCMTAALWSSKPRSTQFPLRAAASMFSHLRDGIYWLASGMKLLSLQSLDPAISGPRTRHILPLFPSAINLLVFKLASSPKSAVFLPFFFFPGFLDTQKKESKPRISSPCTGISPRPAHWWLACEDWMCHSW